MRNQIAGNVEICMILVTSLAKFCPQGFSSHRDALEIALYWSHISKVQLSHLSSKLERAIWGAPRLPLMIIIRSTGTRLTVIVVEAS